MGDKGGLGTGAFYTEFPTQTAGQSHEEVLKIWSQ